MRPCSCLFASLRTAATTPPTRMLPRGAATAAVLRPAVPSPTMMMTMMGRGFSSSARREGMTEGQKDRAAAGPFTLKAGLLFSLTGLGLYLYFQREKALVEERRKAETATAKVGRPKIGGKFVLTDQDGKEWDSEKEMEGKWCLVYFGFTNCPDICPEELDKMSNVVTSLSSSSGDNTVDLLPIFITCDPARDSIPAIKTYVQDFHPSLIGLTGSYDTIKSVCKLYRVYFSTPPSVKPGEDYLVDHSIFFYLMDPKGKFVDAFGRSMGEKEVEGRVRGFVGQWKEGGGKGPWSDQ